MAKSGKDNTFEEMLTARLKWALESTIVHFLGKPDRNSIEDWAELLAFDMAGERSSWQRPSVQQTRLAAEDVTPPQKNHKVTSPTL